MKILLSVIALLFTFLSGCTDQDKNKTTSDEVEKVTGMSEKETDDASSNIPAVKKYNLKSGIITFDKKEMGVNKKQIVYFDDYGTKERNESYDEEGKIEEFRFTDGEKMYIVNYRYNKEKIAYIMGPGTSGTELKFTPEPLIREKDIEKYKYKKLPVMKVAGKDCNAYSMEVAKSTTVFAGWDNILLYTETKTPFGDILITAVKIEENADVDPSLFKVPSGHQVKNM